MKSTISSRQLRAFLALANRRNYTHAAGDLGLSQSALTHSIQALEKDLGVTLVCFVRRKLELTPTGRKILPRVKKILAEMKAIQAHAGVARPAYRRAVRHPLAA